LLGTGSQWICETQGKADKSNRKSLESVFKLRPKLWV